MEYRQFTEKELKWIESFKRVMKKAPSTLFMFVGNGIQVYPKDENNMRYINERGGMSNEAPNINIITNMENDGGDY